jgi:hypothetical protein
MQSATVLKLCERSWNDCLGLVDRGAAVVQVTFPPPYGGYDHNWALFGLGYNATNLTHDGVISDECVPTPPLSPAGNHRTNQTLVHR